MLQAHPAAWAEAAAEVRAAYAGQGSDGYQDDKTAVGKRALAHLERSRDCPNFWDGRD